MLADQTLTRVEYNRPWLAPYQKAALFRDERYCIVEGSTKSGKTAPCLIWLAEQAMAGKEGWNYWWVAPVYSQAEIAYRRMKRGLPRELYHSNDSDKWIELANGTRIWFKTAEKPDNLYGEDVYAAVIDEASRCREEAWEAIRSTITATRGPVRIIGNVKGRKNWAYRMARKAEAGESGMHYARVTAYDAVKAGILDHDEIEAARRELPDAVFRELYLAEASDDEGNPFGIKAIRECIAPLSEADPKAWGWDLAKSVDWTAGIALDRKRRTCRFHRFQKPWQETIETIRHETAATPALVDSTGVGDPIVESLQRAQGRNFEGFKFSSPSKQQLMEGLALAIQRQEVRFPDGVIVSELEAFEYVYTRTGVRYSAPEGMHDDCVMALALAVQKMGRPPSTMSSGSELKGFI
jgi:phage FluMu gp28-like protein